MTSVLILTEKHATRHILIRNKESLYQVALAILQNRLTEGWYSEPNLVEPLGFAPEDIARMVKGLRKAAEAAYATYHEATQCYRKEKAQWDEIQLAISSGDGKLAWAVLQSRADYEYERVELAECEEPDEPAA